MKILMVDDDELTTKAFARLLGREFEVVCARTVDEARRRIDGGERFDVVVADMWFGGPVTGEDLYEHIRTVDSAQADRFFLLLGTVPPPDEPTRLPRDCYLQKVVTRDALIAMLKRFAGPGFVSAA